MPSSSLAPISSLPPPPLAYLDSQVHLCEGRAGLGIPIQTPPGQVHVRGGAASGEVHEFGVGPREAIRRVAPGGHAPLRRGGRA